MLASVYASLSFFGGMLLTVFALAITKFIEYRLHGYRLPWVKYSESMDKLPGNTFLDSQSNVVNNGSSFNMTFTNRHAHRGAKHYRLGPCVIERNV